MSYGEFLIIYNFQHSNISKIGRFCKYLKNINYSTLGNNKYSITQNLHLRLVICMYTEKLRKLFLDLSNSVLFPLFCSIEEESFSEQILIILFYQKLMSIKR